MVGPQMRLIPQDTERIRSELAPLVYRDIIAILCFGVAAGMLLGNILVLFEVSENSALAFGVPIGLLAGACFSIRYYRQAGNRFNKYYIELYDDVFRVNGIVARKGMMEIQFKVNDVAIVAFGRLSSPRLFPESTQRGIMAILNERALSIIEKNGSSVTFESITAAFSKNDLQHLRVPDS